MKTLRDLEVADALYLGDAGPEAVVGDQVKLFLDQEANPFFPEFILGIIQHPIVKVDCGSKTSYVIEYDEADLDGAASLIRPGDVIDYTATSVTQILIEAEAAARIAADALRQPLDADLTAYAADPAAAIAANLASSTGGSGAADAGMVVRFNPYGGLSTRDESVAGIAFYSIATGTASTGIYAQGASYGINAASVTGTGVVGASESGVGISGSSVSGTHHAVYGTTGIDQSFVARLKGAFGWIRGAYTGRIHPLDTLTADRTYELPDASGTLPVVPSYTDLTAANVALDSGDFWWDTTLKKLRVATA